VSEALFRLRVEAIEGEAANHHEKPVALAIWQGLANLVLMVPLFLATYLATWAGWLASDRGWDAKWASAPINQFWGIFNLVPQKLQSLWHYHQEALNFHVNLHTPHSYASNPLTWLLLYRPTSFFYEGAANGEAGCTFSEGCSSAITALGNPVIWYAALIALVLLVIRYFKHRESVPGLILLGIAAGYLPWLVFMNRTVFQFYAITFLPWLMLALTFILKNWLQGKAAELRQKAEQRLLIFFALATAVSIYFYPIWTGLQVSYWFWSAHMWIPSWI
jgi:dolichyl-phosphate-mannose--protein O-mannosyl transferase